MALNLVTDQVTMNNEQFQPAEILSDYDLDLMVMLGNYYLKVGAYKPIGRKHWNSPLNLRGT